MPTKKPKPKPKPTPKKPAPKKKPHPIPPHHKPKHNVKPQTPHDHVPPPPPVQHPSPKPYFARKWILGTWDPNPPSQSFGPYAMARRCVDAGAGFLVQINEENRPYLRDYVRTMQGVMGPLGLPVGAWEQLNWTQRAVGAVANDIHDFGLMCYQACIEADISANNSFPGDLRYLMGPSFPLNVLTTFGGLDTPEKNKPWIEAGYSPVSTEAYEVDNAQASPGSLDRDAYWRGWPKWLGELCSVPCVGCYHGWPLTRTDVRQWGSAVMVYCAETMTEEDIQALGRIK